MSMQKRLNRRQKKLNLFFWILRYWNNIYNLTNLGDFEKILCNHFSDSLILYPYIKKIKRILDVGTGAGFPGIPLAVIFPEKEFTLIDSNSKKIKFLLYLKYALSLRNVKVIHCRFEKYVEKNNFDIVLSRAVNPEINIFSCVKKLGFFFKKIAIMKGKNFDYRIKNFSDQIEVHSLKIPKTSMHRYLVIYNHSNNCKYNSYSSMN